MRVEANRRDFLRGALATSAALIAARSRALAFNAERHFAPVKVSRDRIIREVVGLRPYRAEGFVVEAERIGPKLLVHNYGHGGAGMTLSWGTASLATDLARGTEPGADRGPHAGIPHGVVDATGSPRHRQKNTTVRHFAVLGCGVSGLSTARLLQRRFQNGPGTVTIYAKDLPPDTTSNISGAHWSPTTVFDPAAVSAKFTEQFRQACRISNRAFQLLAGAEYGVRWIDTFELYRHEAAIERELPGGNDLYPQIEIHRDPDHY